MSWLDDLRKRKDKSAGKYEVEVNGAKITVPLTYPTAASKAKIVDRIAEMEKAKNSAKVVVAIDEIDVMMLKACVAEGDATDDELLVIVREAGGHSGDLIRRCSQLLGLDMVLNISSTDGKR